MFFIIFLLAILRKSIFDHIHASYIKPYQYHDHVIKWKHFPRYRPFVRGIHISKASDAKLEVLFDLHLNKGLSNKPNFGYLKSLCINYDDTVMNINHPHHWCQQCKNLMSKDMFHWNFNSWTDICNWLVHHRDMFITSWYQIATLWAKFAWIIVFHNWPAMPYSDKLCPCHHV